MSTRPCRAFWIFFEWWRLELGDMLPKSLHNIAKGQPRTILLFDAERLTILERTGSVERKVGEASVALDDKKPTLPAELQQGRQRQRCVTVRLIPQLGLRKTFNVPLAAMNDLGQMLRFEIDRLTPFPVEQICFKHRVLATDVDKRFVTVKLHIAPRVLVERARVLAEAMGFHPTRVELTDPDEKGDGHGLNLLPNQTEQSDKSKGRLNRILAAVTVLLSVGPIAIPFHREMSAASTLEQELASAKVGAEESVILRERLQKMAAARRFVLAGKTDTPMLTRILAELTQVVPDDAYITELVIQDGDLQMYGYAANTADLISILERSPWFRSPRFRSPVIQDSQSVRERFHISAELANKGG